MQVNRVGYAMAIYMFLGRNSKTVETATMYNIYNMYNMYKQQHCTLYTTVQVVTCVPIGLPQQGPGGTILSQATSFR